MTEPTSPALEIALAYFHAWTGHDLDKAMEYIAEDVVWDAPAGRLEGGAAYRAGQERTCRRMRHRSRRQYHLQPLHLRPRALRRCSRGRSMTHSHRAARSM